jgi:hypothetical protein
MRAQKGGGSKTARFVRVRRSGRVSSNIPRFVHSQVADVIRKRMKDSGTNTSGCARSVTELKSFAIIVARNRTGSRRKKRTGSGLRGQDAIPLTALKCGGQGRS